MKPLSKVLASTALIIVAYTPLPVLAVDATTSRHPSHHAMMMSDARRDMKVEKHISELHAKLKITDDEEPLWSEVAKAMNENAKELDQAIDKRESMMSNATAVDDLNAYAEIAQAHANAVKNLSAAFTPLYDAMSDDQKKLADDVFLHHMHAGKKSHHMIK